MRGMKYTEKNVTQNSKVQGKMRENSAFDDVVMYVCNGKELNA